MPMWPTPSLQAGLSSGHLTRKPAASPPAVPSRLSTPPAPPVPPPTARVSVAPGCFCTRCLFVDGSSKALARSHRRCWHLVVAQAGAEQVFRHGDHLSFPGSFLLSHLSFSVTRVRVLPDFDGHVGSREFSPDDTHTVGKWCLAPA